MQQHPRASACDSSAAGTGDPAGAAACSHTAAQHSSLRQLHLKRKRMRGQHSSDIKADVCRRACGRCRGGSVVGQGCGGAADSHPAAQRIEPCRHAADKRYATRLLGGASDRLLCPAAQAQVGCRSSGRSCIAISRTQCSSVSIVRAASFGLGCRISFCHLLSSSQHLRKQMVLVWSSCVVRYQRSAGNSRVP